MPTSIPRGIGWVTGRVLSSDGEPVSHAHVSVRSVQLGGADFGITTDDGTFAVAVQLSRGPYEAVVSPPLPEFPFTQDSNEVSVNLTTRYPVPIPLVGGVVTSGIDIRLKSERRFRLRGRVSTASGWVPNDAKLSFAFKRTVDIEESWQGFVPVSEQGVANLPFVPSGHLIIWATAGGVETRTFRADEQSSYLDYAGGGRFAAVTEVDVEDRPLDVVVTLMPAPRLGGRVLFVGDAPKLSPLSRMIVRTMLPTGAIASSSYGDPDGIVKSDGTFTIEGAVGERCLKLDGAPPGWQIRDITYQGRSIFNVPILFPSGGRLDEATITLERAHLPVPEISCPPSSLHRD